MEKMSIAESKVSATKEDRSMKKYIKPVLIGEFRGFRDDVFEYIDTRHGGVKKRLNKRTYVIECDDGVIVQSYNVDQVSIESLPDCKIKKGDIVLALIESMKQSMGSITMSCSQISVCD